MPFPQLDTEQIPSTLEDFVFTIAQGLVREFLLYLGLLGEAWLGQALHGHRAHLPLPLGDRARGPRAVMDKAPDRTSASLNSIFLCLQVRLEHLQSIISSRAGRMWLQSQTVALGMVFMTQPLLLVWTWTRINPSHVPLPPARAALNSAPKFLLLFCFKMGNCHGWRWLKKSHSLKAFLAQIAESQSHCG